MTDQFVPTTELEQRLIDAQEGHISPDEFMAALLDGQVFMPILDKHAIKGFQDSTQAVPLTLQDEDGREVLVLFSTPERGREFLKQYPGYGGGLVAETRWILERVGSGVGITLNPGWSAGFDIEAQAVQELAGTSG